MSLLWGNKGPLARRPAKFMRGASWDEMVSRGKQSSFHVLACDGSSQAVEVIGLVCWSLEWEDGCCIEIPSFLSICVELGTWRIE